MEDADLLTSFARDRSEPAFAEFVRRHLDFVYATALRTLSGDAHRARDVAQSVFIAAARQASALSERRVPSAWLYRVTRNLAADAVRREQRRLRREQAFSTMNEIERGDPAQAEWERLRPALDLALSGLAASDREAVILRFFERCNYAEIGQRLSLSADAARLRVDRALEKMRRVLVRKGIPSTAAALAVVLSVESGICAPAGLATAVAGGAVSAAAGGAAFAQGAYLFMASNKIAVALAAAAAIAGTAGVLYQGHRNAQLEREVAGLMLESDDLPGLQQTHRRLEKTLADQRALAEANEANARLLAQGATVQTDVQALGAKLAARGAKLKRSSTGPELSESTAQELRRLQALVDAKDWDDAVRLLKTLNSTRPAGSYDQFIAEDTLFKILWQEKGPSAYAEAQAAIEQVEAMLRQHPDYLSAAETLEHRQWQTDLNFQVAQSGSSVPDQWFPAAQP